LLKSEIVVPQGREQVWSIVGDPAQSSRWDRSIARVIPESSLPLGVGWRGTTVAPSGMRQQFQITEYQPPELLSFKLLESKMFRSASLRFTLLDTGSGTRVIHSIELDLRHRILWPILRILSPRALARDLDYLKDELARDAR